MEQVISTSCVVYNSKKHSQTIKMNSMAEFKLLFQKLNASYQCVKRHNNHCINKYIRFSNL